jgi:hypothetical protein
MNNIMRVIGKYFFPVVFFLIGLERIIAGLTTKTVTDSTGKEYLIEQNGNFVLAGILCFLISAIIFLFVSGKLNKKIVIIIGAVSIPVSIIVIVMNFLSIKNEVEAIEFKREVKGEMVLRIMDIKDAQVAYKMVHGDFCDNIDSLVLFVKTGKVPKPVSFGNVPARRITPAENDSLYPGENKAIDNNMSEIEAWKLSKMNVDWDNLEGAGWEDLKDFKRDTIYISVIDKYFSGEKFLDKRRTIQGSLNFTSKFEFNPDSMAYIPHCPVDSKFGLAKDQVIKSTGPAPTLLIWAVHPLDSLEMDSIYLGDLKKVDFNGSWQ